MQREYYKKNNEISRKRFMKKIIKITTPLDTEKIVKLRTGDFVNITGNIYGARDAAHKRFFELIEKGKKLPINLKGQIIFYAGPTPAKPRYPCGSIGPTTSYRMDPYTPDLLEGGLRSKEVIESMKKNKAVYLGAVGGAAALIARSIKKSEVVAYEDLGAEAIHRYYVEDFPAIVIIDCLGNSLYETEPPKYRK
jgi:fumarate hydratase subunit beta